ncbi:MAG: hypothetical protein HY327_11380 [Chloroflexi bacterium]|nr:hypothetical protein [Chloroflexota bacterium]
MATQREILWTVTDPRGLNITLVDDVWHEIVGKHHDMAPFFDAVRLTAQDPEEVYFDPKSTESRTTGAKIYRYYRGELPSGEEAGKMTAVVVKVVSEAGGNSGYVETAFVTDRVPKRLVLEWKR